MAKRFIGIDLDDRTLRVAVATEEKGTLKLTSTAEKTLGEEESITEALGELAEGSFKYGDRLASTLAAGDGFVRWLTLPFNDEKKIEATLQFELDAQLPVSTDSCITVSKKPREAGENQYIVTAAAAPQQAVSDFLAPFDEDAIPLQVLDIAPFSYAAGLRGQLGNCILVCISGKETIAALMLEGQVADYRLLPGGNVSSEQALASMLSRETMALQRSAAQNNLPLCLIGSGVTPSMQETLLERFEECRIPQFQIKGQTVSPAFLPAVSLAYRAAIGEKEKEFNFRRGSFALKSEWASFKSGLITASVLLALIALVFAGSSYFNYAQKAERADQLQQEMVRIYKETFPNSRAIVDIPLQMKSSIRDLGKRGMLVSATQRTSPLVLLQEISENVPQETLIDIREMVYNPDGVRLEGTTSSFDAINKVAKNLEKSPLIEAAQITDAKMSLEGSKVDFRMQLTLNGKKDL